MTCSGCTRGWWRRSSESSAPRGPRAGAARRCRTRRCRKRRAGRAGAGAARQGRWAVPFRRRLAGFDEQTDFSARTTASKSRSSFRRARTSQRRLSPAFHPFRPSPMRTYVRDDLERQRRRRRAGDRAGGDQARHTCPSSRWVRSPCTAASSIAASFSQDRLSQAANAIRLRLTPARNGQHACINLADDFSFDGAVAQLARARGWQPRGQGFESPQLHSEDSGEMPHRQGRPGALRILAARR